MAGTTIGVSAITAPEDLVNGIVNALKNANSVGWFSQVWKSPTDDAWLLESTNNVDSFLSVDSTQKYRIYLVGTKDQTTTKFKDLTIYYGGDDQLKLNAAGNGVAVASGTPSFPVINALNLPSTSLEVNFRMTITNRGWALAIWPTVRVNSSAQNFVCVFQRPVNPTNGAPKVEGKAPIFALYHPANSTTNYFNWGIVRELDVPSSREMGNTAAVSRYNMYKVTLDWAHPNLFDNNSHVVKFAYGLATPRHLYLDEIDLMCFVNASAFAGQQNIKITMYGESAERQYRSTWGDVAYGTSIAGQAVPKTVAGARIGILSVGGGIA